MIETSRFLYHFASRCFFVFFTNKQSFLTTVSYHYLQQHIPVFQSFSHTMHDLMAGLMSCSLHVEGHCIVLMNHEKGKHTSLCELLNNQPSLIHTVHLPKVCSINKHRYWMFHLDNLFCEGPETSQHRFCSYCLSTPCLSLVPSSRCFQGCTDWPQFLCYKLRRHLKMVHSFPVMVKCHQYWKSNHMTLNHDKLYFFFTIHDLIFNFCSGQHSICGFAMR